MTVLWRVAERRRRWLGELTENPAAEIFKPSGPSCKSELRKEFSPWIPIEKLPSERNLSGKPAPDEILEAYRPSITKVSPETFMPPSTKLRDPRPVSPRLVVAMTQWMVRVVRRMRAPSKARQR